MEEKLKFRYGTVSEWLRFAESKNNMLIGFSAAMIAGLLAIAPDTIKANNMAETLMVLSLVLIGAGTVIAIISHLPRLRFIQLRLAGEKDQPHSLMYFDHIHRNYTHGKAYVKALVDADGEGGKDIKISKNDIDLGNQIIQLSRIASMKYGHFTIGLVLSMVGFAVAIITISVQVL